MKKLYTKLKENVNDVANVAIICTVTTHIPKKNLNLCNFCFRRDDLGNLIFACKYVTKDGLCSQYDKRLEMCKRYPVKILKFKPILHEGCGFKVVEKDFLSYLK